VKAKKLGGGEIKNGGKYWEMFGIPIFGGGMVGVLEKAAKWLEEKEGKHWIATVNPEFLMAAEREEKFKKMLQEKTFNVPDGVGLVWAKLTLCPNFQFSIFNFQLKTLSRWWQGVKVGGEILAGKHRGELVPGVELMREMIQISNFKIQNLRVFLLGGWGDRAEKTARNFVKVRANHDSPIQKFEIGWNQGEPAESNSVVIKKINDFKAEILFVAYGMKRQEEWIAANLGKLKTVKIVMGVGRSFDYYSGDLPRAPEWLRKMGLEWLYSLYREPKRWRRQLELPKFVWKIING